MSIDERLMSVPPVPAPMEEEEYPESSAERSGLLRRQQRNTSDEDDEGQRDWAAVKGQSRIQQAKEVASQVVSSVKSLSTATSRWLIGAWRNLIPSYGTSFFYIYFHLAARNLFRNLFAPLGSEWFDKPGITEEKRDALGKGPKTVEVMGVIMISIILFIVIVWSLGPFLMIIYVYNNPENLLKMPGILFDAISALIG